jgi:hypothetical protein
MASRYAMPMASRNCAPRAAVSITFRVPSITLPRCAARLSVPDALEPTHRQHEDAGAPRTPFGQTRDPELRPFAHRAQRLNVPGAAAGTGMDQCENIVDLVVIHANDDGGETSCADCGIPFDLRRRDGNLGEVAQQRFDILALKNR